MWEVSPSSLLQLVSMGITVRACCTLWCDDSVIVKSICWAFKLLYLQNIQLPNVKITVKSRLFAIKKQGASQYLLPNIFTNSDTWYLVSMKIGISSFLTSLLLRPHSRELVIPPKIFAKSSFPRSTLPQNLKVSFGALVPRWRYWLWIVKFTCYLSFDE